MDRKRNENTVKLTVFTPTYNRAHTLPRTYESLKKQDNQDFIWLIVDDGSKDNTEEIVRTWQKQDNGFEIRYVYKQNGGMHTAHNVAYENIDTELNVCIDSDDMLAEGAVQKILNKWEEIGNLGYAGMVGLDADFKGDIIGKSFPKEMTETTLTEYYASGGAGDKKLVYRTDVIKQYPPYPVFEGEKYVALAYKYRLIDQDYKLAVLPEVLCKVEYQADGSTGTMWKQYLTNPKGFAFWRRIAMQYPESRKRKFVDCVHYCSSSQIAKERDYIRKSPCKMMTVFCIPLGWILTGYIKLKVRQCDKNKIKKEFSADFLRMTGKEYKGSLSDYFQIFMCHNLKTMWWYRRKGRKGITGGIVKYKMYRISRKYGIEMNVSRLGRGLYLGHPYNITVNAKKLGNYCSLHKGCTIGRENRGSRVGIPTLGNKVYVGINATVIGKINIGDDVLIAPNSFVNFDVPSHSIVIGNPAKIHFKERATEGYIIFCDEE